MADDHLHSEQDLRRMLVRGLVGPHSRLYHTSVYFRSAIDVLAEQLLPQMVDGLAAHAVKADEDFKERLEATMRHPSQPLFFPSH